MFLDKTQALKDFLLGILKHLLKNYIKNKLKKIENSLYHATQSSVTNTLVLKFSLN